MQWVRTAPTKLTQVVIRKGQDWGERAPLPSDSHVVASNLELHRYLQDTLGANPSLPLAPIGLLGGDLCKTVGGAGQRDRLTSDEAVTLACDLVEARLDGEQWWFASHLVARTTWLTGRLTFVMNAAWRGAWNVAPRGHPGDGRVDVFDTTMSVTDRLKGWRRVNHGGHVPHPDIAVTRVKRYEDAAGERPRLVELDGVAVGRITTIELRVFDAALPVVV